MNHSQSTDISPACIHGYSLSGIGKTIQWSSLDLLLLIYLTDILYIPAGTVATILTASLVAEILFGFIFSVLAEKLSMRIRKYSNQTIVFAPLAALAFAALFVPPPNTVAEPALYVAIMLIFFRISYITIDVPNNALMVRLSKRAQTRTKLSSMRSIYNSFSSLIISALIFLTFREQSADEQRTLLSQLVLAAAFLSLVTIVASSMMTRPHEKVAAKPSCAPKTLDILRAITGNGPLLIFLGVCMLVYLTLPLFLKSIPYYAKYIVGDASLSGTAFAAIMGAQVFAFHLSERLAYKRGKLLALKLLCGLTALLTLACWFIRPESQTGFVCACIAVGGVIASVHMLLWAVMPDLIDGDGKNATHRVAAAAMGSFATCNKIMKGLSPVIISFALALSDFEADTRLPESAEQTLLFVMLVLPAVGALIALLILHQRFE